MKSYYCRKSIGYSNKLPNQVLIQCNQIALTLNLPQFCIGNPEKFHDDAVSVL